MRKETVQLHQPLPHARESYRPAFAVAPADATFPQSGAQECRTICSGVCHGTLGELFQGPAIRNGEMTISLVSLPVKQYSYVHFLHGEEGDIDADLAGKEKCRRAIELYLAWHRKRLPPGRWAHDTDLLQGKGMASSTADIVATIRCLDSIFSRTTRMESVARILRAIERSDSVLLDTYALYLSARQEVVHCFEGDPRFFVCYIDEGGIVDTEKAGQPLLSHYERHLSAYLALQDRTVHAFLRKDKAEIARCATASALLAQDVMPKRSLDLMLSRQARHKADGIVVAHTGSLLGYLYVQKPSCTEMGELCSFFRGLGYQCRFVQTGF